jgi:integral membrane protein (TIGR01906 family)
LRGEPLPRPARGSGALRLGIGILIPFVLVLTNVRLLLTPAFVSVEYSTPGFPDDPYGFSRDDRVRLAQIARVYLLNDAAPSFLADLRGADGQPLYNERELSHMVDVKRLVQEALTVWRVLTIALGVLCLVAWRVGSPGTMRRGLSLGARITLASMAVLFGFVLLSFSLLFTGFHNVFFESGTWVFYYSDTLIRLFPMRFWRDVFALLMILTLTEAALLLFVGGRLQPPTIDQPRP